MNRRTHVVGFSILLVFLVTLFQNCGSFHTLPVSQNISNLSSDAQCESEPLIQSNGTIEVLAGTPLPTISFPELNLVDGTNQIVFDSQGNGFLIASSGIVKIDPRGQFTVFAGIALKTHFYVNNGGPVDGVGTSARFYFLNSIAIDPSDNLIVSDYGYIRKITPQGVVSTPPGQSGIFSNFDPESKQLIFGGANSVAVDRSGKIVTSDANSKVIRKISADGQTSIFAGSLNQVGIADGLSSLARFRFPSGLAFDSSGNLYVNDCPGVRKITPEGQVLTVSPKLDFCGSFGLAVDAQGNIFRTHSETQFAIQKISPQEVISDFYSDPEPRNLFDFSYGLNMDSNGNLYSLDNQGIYKISPLGILTVAFHHKGWGATDGNALNSEFRNPTGMVFDKTGHLYFSEFTNSLIRRLDLNTNTVSTVAGRIGDCHLVDGITSGASFCNPRHLVSDSNGNIYAGDYYQSIIRKITPDGVVTSLAVGSQNLACAGVDDKGVPARIVSIAGLAIDDKNNIYILDNQCSNIRMVNAAGILTPTPIAGPGQLDGDRGGFVDGSASSARFRDPSGLAIDSNGNLYVAEVGNQAIRKIDKQGNVTTVAGHPESGRQDGSWRQVNGPATTAIFAYPSDLVVANNGDILVADINTVRRISNGQVDTIISQNLCAPPVVTSGSLPASLANVDALTIDPEGRLLISSRNAILRTSPVAR